MLRHMAYRSSILPHIKYDGIEQPIAFTSCFLSKAELKYAQLVKEGLAIIYKGLARNIINNLFGSSFTICSDHKPFQRPI